MTGHAVSGAYVMWSARLAFAQDEARASVTVYPRLAFLAGCRASKADLARGSVTFLNSHQFISGDRLAAIRAAVDMRGAQVAF